MSRASGGGGGSQSIPVRVGGTVVLAENRPRSEGSVRAGGRPRATRDEHSTPDQRFGGWLSGVRTNAGVAVAEVAAHAGVKTKTVQNIEAGAPCSVRIAQAYAALCGVAPEVVLAAREAARAASATRDDRGKRLGDGGDGDDRVGVLVPKESLPDPPPLSVGRDGEIYRLEELFEHGARLVTVVGPVGVGKTHLATVAAHRLLATGTVQRVVFVPLAEHSRRWLPADPPQPHLERSEERLVARAILDSAGRTIQAEPSELDQVAEAFAGASTLVVLDNCETFRAGAAAVAQHLGDLADGPSILGTSQAALGASLEQVLAAVPLTTPPSDLGTSDVEGLASYPSVALFCAHGGELELTPGNASAVIEIVRALDGLPLFIEYAARLLGNLSLEIVRRNAARLALGGRIAGDERHASAGTALDWAWGHLSPPERGCLWVASAFRGGFSRSAFDEVASSVGVGGDGVDGLVDRSILRVDPATGRLFPLEVFRQMVARRSTEEQRRQIADAHAAYFGTLAERCGAALTGPEQVDAVARLEADRLNIGTSIQWTLYRRDAESALRVCGALWRWWARRDALEGRRLITQALRLPHPRVDNRTVAMALLGAGHVSIKLADYDTAEQLLVESMRLAEECSEVGALALMNRGILREERGDDSCESFFLASLRCYQILGNNRGIAHAVNNLGLLSLRQADLQAAATRFDTAIAVFDDLGDVASSALAYDNRGWTAWRQDDIGLAERCYLVARRQFHAAGDIAKVANVDVNLALLDQRRGAHRAAAARLVDAAATARFLRDRKCTAEILTTLAVSLRAKGDTRRALQFEEMAVAIATWSKIKLHEGVGTTSQVVSGSTFRGTEVTRGADPFDTAIREAAAEAERLAQP